ncbi:MAG: sensor histidine kinase [Vicinamibacteria bacterium]|nr:sensor histidine kinase [Vicinamibacteria bacterium]
MQREESTNYSSLAKAGPKRWRWLLLWTGVVLALGLIQSVFNHLQFLSWGKEGAFVHPFIGTMSWAVTAGILFFGVRWLVRRHPLRRTDWPRGLPLYLIALLAYGITLTTLMWGLRASLYWLFDLKRYMSPSLSLVYAKEFAGAVIQFTVMAVILHAVNALNEARRRELRTAHLESNLARAELRNLRLQIQPHFLFNALNTISSTMYRDPAAADEVLTQLAELLRASLKTAHTDELPLADELTTLDCYCGIMRARLGERLKVEVDVAPEVRHALVPSMLLQPLVENAIRHGNAERIGQARIAVRAHARGQELLLEIEDDGPGTAGDHDLHAAGTGLSVTTERLNLLYGGAHSLEARNGPMGGFLVRIALPLRKAEPMRSPCES